MSSVIRDLAEGEFIGPRDKQNNPLPSPPGNYLFKFFSHNKNFF